MRILLSNDDGILAPGLAALRAAVADMGEVCVVAPDSPQSAAGHAITLRHPLTVKRVRVGGAGAFDGISVAGRPADCVRLAIRKLLEDPPDLVLTGINAGANVGINVFYSGTVAAAAEAAMCDIPAVAFSAARPVESPAATRPVELATRSPAEGGSPAAALTGDLDFERIARLCRWVLERLLEDTLVRRDLVNVNIPVLGPGMPLGVRVVRQSTAGLEDIYHPHASADGGEAYKLGDEYSFLVPAESDTDVGCLSRGYITVTPLHVDMTNRERLDRLSECRWGDPPR